MPSPASNSVLCIIPWSSLNGIGKCLGAGGYGQVYEARDALLYRSVALKCLNIRTSEPGGDKLIGEARLAAPLQHLAFVKR
ncbi:MAG: hypothetical protein Q7T25_09860 [Sideroxyarcus sp.]|nr:hypothetical protein [Sideroxyarcus sp.]